LSQHNYNQEYTDYQLNRSFARKLIRGAYLRNILKYVKGKSIDLGCGIGELLSILPEGSVGLEVNEDTANFCKKNKLNVIRYDPDKDKYEFRFLSGKGFKTFTSCHVLEHLVNPDNVLKKIMSFAQREKLERVIIVVPGYKGYLSDKTHVTFIDKNYIQEKGLENFPNYELIHKSFFPFNMDFVQNYFTHNELVLVYERD